MSTETARDWQPTHTWVVVIGTLAWQETQYFDQFPTKERRDAALVAFFRQAGVPDSQILYLQDGHATRQAVDVRVAHHLRQAQAGDFLVYYYCGHGYHLDSGIACLACYDACADGVADWPMTAIPAQISAHFTGARALLAFDCCYSGNLADAVTRHAGPVSYACLTSSSASESSTGNWTFSDGLLAGLRGDAYTDEDSSATITLHELADQILGDMAFAEEQLACFVTTGQFAPTLVLAAARPKPDPAVGRRVEAYSGGKWYKAQIVAAADGQFQVHYYGWDSSDDEWITSAAIRDATPVQYAVGSAVEVRWKRSWYPAHVLEVRGGIHYIKYNDYDSDWNEWVASARIRPLQ